MSEKDPFKVEQEGHIAWLTLNRPDNRNTMGFAFPSEDVMEAVRAFMEKRPPVFKGR